MNFLKSLLIAALVIASTAVPALAQSNAHRKSHKDLMAARTKQKSQKKLIDNSAFVNLYDDIAPEPDIYMEGWNSKRVNPFKESDVPARYTIDVTNYHMPVPGQITSNYGYRPKFGRMHKGVDLHIRSNDTIYAAFDGKIRLTNYEPKGYGNYIIIRHPNKLETVYGHLNKFLVKPDQVVKAGQPIALGGSTGRSTGPHLHFETRFMGYAINPSAIFDFTNKTTHTDTYTFTKTTYTEARNFANKKSKKSESAYQAGKQQNAGTYTVRQGDTLSSIARANGIAVSRLESLNGINRNSRLTVGQVLKVK